MTPINTSYADAFSQGIRNNLRTSGQDEKTANAIGKRLGHIEDELIREYSKSEDSRDEGKLKALELKYKRAIRAYEGFMQIMANVHQLIMRGIQNLRVQ